MFKRLFSALPSLTGNIEALAASFAEANERFRHNVLSEGNGEPAQLEHHEPALTVKARRKAS
jgi:hypothetical protein